jgi:large subunit ribosomal protein L6
MKKDLIKKVNIPEGIEINIDGTKITVKGKIGESSKIFKIKNIKIEKDAENVIISSKNATKKEKKVMNSIAAHIENMISGVNNKFEYKLKICFSHFPITVEVKKNEAIIKNFLGEKISRKAKILDDVEVKVDKDIIEVSSKDRESAGQTSANLEKATWIRMRDRRVFQDGIFITKKPGRKE